jgi:hypothetical protein
MPHKYNAYYRGTNRSKDKWMEVVKYRKNRKYRKYRKYRNKQK